MKYATLRFLKSWLLRLLKSLMAQLTRCRNIAQSYKTRIYNMILVVTVMSQVNLNPRHMFAPIIYFIIIAETGTQLIEGEWTYLQRRQRCLKCICLSCGTGSTLIRGYFPRPHPPWGEEAETVRWRGVVISLFFPFSVSSYYEGARCTWNLKRGNKWYLFFQTSGKTYWVYPFQHQLCSHSAYTILFWTKFQWDHECTPKSYENLS